MSPSCPDLPAGSQASSLCQERKGILEEPVWRPSLLGHDLLSTQQPVDPWGDGKPCASSLLDHWDHSETSARRLSGSLGLSRLIPSLCVPVSPASLLTQALGSAVLNLAVKQHVRHSNSLPGLPCKLRFLHSSGSGRAQWERPLV